jgi:triphosphoribosyl-dephospho-CoA synthase
MERMTQHEQIIACAEKALLYEIATTPKPGLVDRRDNGAHDDMDFFTFLDSIRALAPFFDNYFYAGYFHNDTMPELFNKIRKIGKKAENSMLAATNGINTHKGANFSFAIVLAAMGVYSRRNMPCSQSPSFITKDDTNSILEIAAEMCHGLVTKDFAGLEAKTDLTYGEKLYLDHGLTGIRGEAEAGYPALDRVVLPYFRENRHQSREELCLNGLVLLMSTVEDGNIIHRGGIEAWQQVKTETRLMTQCCLSEEPLRAWLTEYNREMIKRRLSPGGAADLLALAIFFALLEGLF